MTRNSLGEFLFAFVLYADNLLTINQIEPLLDRAYKTVFEAVKDVEVLFARGFPDRLGPRRSHDRQTDTGR